MGNRPLSGAAKCCVSLFVLVHLGCLAIGISPFAAPARMISTTVAGQTWTLHEVVQAYQRRTVTGFSGQLFAPLPARSNRYVGAVIRYTDGTERHFHFPRPSETSGFLGEVYLQFHKLSKNLGRPKVAPLYPDVCRYLARRFGTPGKMPREVELIAFYQLIPRHNRAELRTGGGDAWHDYTAILRDRRVYEQKSLFVYSVQPGDAA